VDRLHAPFGWTKYVLWTLCWRSTWFLPADALMWPTVLRLGRRQNRRQAECEGAQRATGASCFASRRPVDEYRNAGARAQCKQVS